MTADTLFDESERSTPDKLRNCTKYVRRQNIARFLCRYEIFKCQVNIKSSVVECGVHHGGEVMTWAHISAALESYNYYREIVGFDTFQGFASVAAQLSHSIAECDSNRFISQERKIEPIKCDANETTPQYLRDNQHLLISLLYLDFDIYQPTAAAQTYLFQRIPKWGSVAFDEVNNPDWPGETRSPCSHGCNCDSTNSNASSMNRTFHSSNSTEQAGRCDRKD
jgi:hypothetical protein